jgi:hypothetical protein
MDDLEIAGEPAARWFGLFADRALAGPEVSITGRILGLLTGRTPDSA